MRSSESREKGSDWRSQWPRIGEEGCLGYFMPRGPFLADFREKRGRFFFLGGPPGNRFFGFFPGGWERRGRPKSQFARFPAFSGIWPKSSIFGHFSEKRGHFSKMVVKSRNLVNRPVQWSMSLTDLCPNTEPPKCSKKREFSSCDDSLLANRGNWDLFRQFSSVYL